MKKLWIATELFFPEETSTAYILTKIANKLSDNYEVTVFCGEPNYQISESSNIDFFLDPKVNVDRLSSGKGDQADLKSRGLRSVKLSVKIFFKLIKNAKKSDKVFIVTNPVSLIVLVAFAKMMKGFELKILVHDVFPENTIPAGIIKSKNSYIYKTLKFIFDWAYGCADHLIVLGRDMKEIILEKVSHFKTNSEITIIENWGDIVNIYPKKKEDFLDKDAPFLDKIVFQYAGNIGRVQGLPEILAMIRTAENDAVLYYFVGEGAIKTQLLEYVEKHDMQNVKFDGAYQRSEQNTVLNTADVAIVTLSEGMLGLGVPSKVYNILAAGKPIFYIGDKRSEIAILIKENNVGYAFEPTQQKEISEFLKTFGKQNADDLLIKSENARQLAAQHYSEEIILNKFLNQI